MHNFLVCDTNYRVFREISQFVDEAFHDVEIFYSDNLETWERDISKQLAKKNEVANTDAESLSDTPAFDATEEIKMVVSVANGSLVKTEDYTGSLMGHEHEKWTKDPLFWRGLIDRQDAEKMNNFLQNLKLDESKTESFRFLNGNTKFNLIKIEGKLLSENESDQNFLFHLIDYTQKPEKLAGENNSGNHIDLIFADAGLLAKSPKQQIEQLSAKGRAHNGTVAPQVIVLGHEDEHQQSAETFSIPAVIDFFYKPLDNLLFLEKISSHVPSIAKKQEEPFLFSADTTFKVEVAQEQQISEYSTYGLQITAPFAVKPGVTIKLYSSLFGQDNISGLWALCFTNRKASGKHINDFAWYGLLPEQSRPIADWYGKNIPADKVLSDQEKLDLMKKKKVEKKGPIIHGAKPKEVKKKYIAVIDLDETTIETIKEIFENQGEEYEVITWGSIHQAAEDLFPMGIKDFPSQERDEIDDGAGADYQINRANRPAFAPDQNVIFNIDKDTLNFKEFNGFPNAGSVLFGVEVKNWRREPHIWKDLVFKKDKHRLHDFLTFVRAGQKAEARFDFQNTEGHLHKICLCAKAPSDGKIEIEMKDETLKSSGQDKSKNAEYETIELIVTDHSFVSYKTKQWVTQIRQLVDQNEQNPKDRKTAILLSGSAEYLRTLDSLAGFGSDGLFAKPFDRVHFLQFWELVKNSYSVLESNSLHRPVSTTHYVDIARPAEATGMGEKGLSLINSKPVATGALARFYHPSLIDSSGRGILARCYKSELKEPGKYLCHFAFFGVKETQLKNIRKLWLSGDEIHKDMSASNEPAAP